MRILSLILVLLGLDSMLLMRELSLLSLHLGIVMTWSGRVMVANMMLLMMMLLRRLLAVGHLVGAPRLMADLVHATTMVSMGSHDERRFFKATRKKTLKRVKASTKDLAEKPAR
jgi:hypothetical protein